MAAYSVKVYLIEKDKSNSVEKGLVINLQKL